MEKEKDNKATYAQLCIYMEFGIIDLQMITIAILGTDENLKLAFYQEIPNCRSLCMFVCVLFVCRRFRGGSDVIGSRLRFFC